jgi:RecA-family ATPase
VGQFELTAPVPSLDEFATRLIAPVVEGPSDAIPGLLPQRGQLVIAGETNIGKSLVALEVISSLVTGLPLWGELTPTVDYKRILYVLGEHYNEVIQRLWQVTRLPMTDQVFLLGPEQLAFDKWLVTQGKQNVQSIAKFQKWTEKCDLIVFDPLSAFVTGVDAENDNLQMRLVLDSMSYIAQTNGCACIVLAHQGKPMLDKTGQEHRRKSYAVRGASAIEDAATNIFYMGRAEGESEASKKNADGMIVELSMRKYKGLAPSSYRLYRDPVTLTHQLLGNRPFVEVKRIDTEARVARLERVVSDRDERIRILAALDGVHVDTIKRALGEKK